MKGLLSKGAVTTFRNEWIKINMYSIYDRF